MAQHDYDIANASGASVRADLNSMADAMVSNNSGATEPTTKFSYMWWADTTTGLMKQRNGANNAWLTRGSLTSSVVPAFESTGIDDNATSTQLTVTDTGILTDGVYLGGTGAANLLSDYEFGTWTPRISAESAADATITVGIANYTKIGRQVFLDAMVTIGSITGTGSTKAIELEGMPFTLSSLAGGSAIGYSGLAGSVSSLQTQYSGATLIRIVEQNGSTAANASGHLQASSTLRINISYMTAS